MAFVVSVALGRAVQSAGIHLKALLLREKVTPSYRYGRKSPSLFVLFSSKKWRKVP